MALDVNPYTVLGVRRDATAAQIAQARHQLVRKYHPDVNHDPDAAARFVEVQQAFDLLSDPPARAEYDRAHDEGGRARVMRSPGGGYGPGGEAAAGLFVEPAVVNFGELSPQRPWADAAVTVAWTGPAPESITRDQGGEWWKVVGSARSASSSMVFHLRASTGAEVPYGQLSGQFTMTVNGTVLTVGLSAQVVAAATFEPPAPARVEIGLTLLWKVLIVVIALLLVALLSHLSVPHH